MTTSIERYLVLKATAETVLAVGNLAGAVYLLLTHGILWALAGFIIGSAVLAACLVIVLAIARTMMGSEAAQLARRYT